MRDRTQFMNAANVRLGRNAFDFYDSAEPSYTLYTDRDYDISFDDIDERELEQHFGNRFQNRHPERNRQHPQERNKYHRGNERVEDYRNYDDIHGGDYDDYYDEFDDEREEDFEDLYDGDFDNEFEEEFEEDDFSEQRRRDHALRARLNRLQRPSRNKIDRDVYADDRRRNFFRRGGRRNERLSVNWPWNRSDMYGPAKKW